MIAVISAMVTLARMSGKRPWVGQMVVTISWPFWSVVISRCRAALPSGKRVALAVVAASRGAVRGAWEEADGKAISAFVHDLVTEWGGSISAEHGIGQLKRDELGRLGDPVQLAMMRGIKKALDPHGLLNPGKLVPPCA